jgi:S-adenosylmethionine decarboxylase
MLLKDLDLDNYLFGSDDDDLDPEEAQDIRERVKSEMLEIFYGYNMSKPTFEE